MEQVMSTNHVRKTFDTALKAASSHLRIEGGVNVLNISDSGFGFWESKKRMISRAIDSGRSVAD